MRATRSAAASGTVLEVRSVSKHFGGLSALQRVSMNVRAGAIHGIIGPNGSGKSTLLSIISGFYRPSEGRIVFDGQDITGWRPEWIARAGLVRTFQLARTFSGLSVWEHLLVAVPNPTAERCWRSLASPSRRWIAPDEIQRARELLSLTRLVHLANEPAANLSYGQQKLLSMAAVVMTGARVLLLDEPMAGVNPALGQVVRQAIREWNRQGLTFVIVEHDMGFVMEKCDEVLVLEAGSVIARGTPDRVRTDPDVIRAYLGG